MLVSPGGYAVPTPNASLEFYRELFAMYKGKIQGYEVDFMIDNFLNQYLFREELGAAEQWLAGMHGAAAESKMSIQYCMALPSDLLASMAFPHVTNCEALRAAYFRVSIVLCVQGSFHLSCWQSRLALCA